MIWDSIKYEWPEAALLLFAAPILMLGFFFLYRYRENKLKAFADTTLLNVIAEKRGTISFWIKSCLICLVWICGVLALMQPKGNERYAVPPSERNPDIPLEKTSVRQKPHDVIFLLDASLSMAVDDTAIGKNRIEQAAEIADEIVSRLRGENVALQVFTSATMQMVPLTPDYLFMRLMLRQVEINEGETEGTDFLQALETLHKNYFDTHSANRKTLIILSDGGDTTLESLQGVQKDEYLKKILHVVDAAASQHLRIDTIGIGSKEGKKVPNVSYEGQPVTSSLDENLLRKLSDVGGGHAYFTREMSTLQIVDAISDSLAKEPIEYEDKPIMQRILKGRDDLIYDWYFQVPLGIGLIAFAMSLLIPETRKKRERLNE